MQNEGGRYSINIKGCSHDALGAIQDRKQTLLFQEMLQSQNIISGHPRKDAPYLQAVASLKSVWTEVPGVFNWVDFGDQVAL